MWTFFYEPIFAHWRAGTIRCCKAHVGSLILISNCTRTSNSAYFYGAPIIRIVILTIDARERCDDSSSSMGPINARLCKLKIYLRNDLNDVIHLERETILHSAVTTELFKSFRVVLISIDFLRDYITNALSSAN